MLSRREFLGQIACAFAAAGVASRIPVAAFAEPEVTAGSLLIAAGPDGIRLYRPGDVLRFVVTATNTGPASMNLNGYGSVNIGRAAHGLRDGDFVEFRL